MGATLLTTATLPLLGKEGYIPILYQKAKAYFALGSQPQYPEQCFLHKVGASLVFVK